MDEKKSASVTYHVLVTINQEALKRKLGRTAKAWVSPAELLVQRGDKVQFISDDSDITLRKGRPQEFIVPGNEGKKRKKRRKIIVPYAVYCRTVNDFAEGNSAPKIIIQE